MGIVCNDMILQIKRWNQWRPFGYSFHPLFYVSFPLSIVYFFFPQYYLLKASPIWACALSTYYHNKFYYSKVVSLGLFLGSIGDILLEMKDHYDVDLFIPGLIAFLLGHLCYIRAFFRIPLEKLAVYIGVPIVLAYYATVMTFLLPNVSYFLIAPIAIYGSVISMMVFFAFNRYLMSSKLLLWTRVLALIGSLFFVASDTTLSFHTFFPGGHLIPESGIIIMVTYYIGQILIAASSQVPFEEDMVVDHVSGLIINPEGEYSSTFIALVG